jgi:LEA14-like dessication related protein
MSFIFKTFIISITCFTLYGCAELAKHTETLRPTAQITGARLANINFDQADIIFDLAIENQNPIAIDLAGLDYDFKIENQSLISGVSSQAVELKANATTPVQLPVTLKFDDLNKLSGDVWKKDNVTYDLNTTVNVLLPVIGKYAVPLRKTGKLPVPRVPDVKIKSINLKNLSFSSAEIVAQLEINNPNNFNLGLKNFNYQLNVNHKKWGQGNISQASTIPKKGKGFIEIPVTLDLMSTGTAMFSMLQSKTPLEYQLTGDATIDTGIELLRNYRLPLDISGKVPVQ